ncbi:MAG: hypothetical protein IKC95_07115 [Oscillospiraceae bacterium]|nr:hypothetical protein [Oscillospiraceae bacterium]
MRHTQNNICKIDPAFYIFIAFSLLVFPVSWIIGWFIAVAFHELCHFVALKLFGIRINSIRIGLSGAIMETEPMSAVCECICALAGPVGGLCLIFISRWAPWVSICALVQSIYNLIPVFPLDGGRVMRRLLYGKKRADIFEIVVILLIVTASFYCSINFQLGLYPFILPVLLLQKSGRLKCPCKLPKQIVQ